MELQCAVGRSERDDVEEGRDGNGSRVSCPKKAGSVEMTNEEALKPGISQTRCGFQLTNEGMLRGRRRKQRGKEKGKKKGQGRGRGRIENERDIDDVVDGELRARSWKGEGTDEGLAGGRVAG
ncbi:hypothetical protein HYFRA_00000543 [Hymenoscyphus fraxineus]|uniref:Uncharacterized protein n=1 Tax=Hymenoscyphus fraxineus TaxID=746836 RepID=A0A9N9PSM0_9HELO|nr:hypothetical protein HYFRA_00000543 [Hymenoscyphus fraxineus]